MLIERSQNLISEVIVSPIGSILESGTIRDGYGVPQQNMRVLGSFAIVLIADGGGFYSDTLQTKQVVAAGDMLLLFPDIAHGYGPAKGGYWSEIYVIFRGPLFDQMLIKGLMRPGKAIHRVNNVADAVSKIKLAMRSATLADSEQSRASIMYQFAALLMQLIAIDEVSQSEHPVWLSSALFVLSKDLGSDLSLQSVAESSAMSYELFRKRFQQILGVSPGRYRARKRIEAACRLLSGTPMTCAQIAESLGFGDEFHFSRRFKQIEGVSPREYRNRVPKLSQRRELQREGRGGFSGPWFAYPRQCVVPPLGFSFVPRIKKLP